MIQIAIVMAASKWRKIDAEALERAASRANVGVLRLTAGPADDAPDEADAWSEEAARALARRVAHDADVVVHKLTHVVSMAATAAADDGASASNRYARWLAAYEAELARSSRRPPPRCVDSVDAQRRLADRAAMYDALRRLTTRDARHRVQQPAHAVLPAAAGAAPPPVPLPAILKTRVACGQPFSHDMTVVADATSLAAAVAASAHALVAQAFVPHDGVYYKTFVIGERVSVARRASVASSATHRFNSQQLPRAAAAGNDDGGAEELAFVRRVARDVGACMQLSVYGVDVVRDARDAAAFAVVDVNFFPGFAEMNDFLFLLLEHARSQLE